MNTNVYENTDSETITCSAAKGFALVCVTFCTRYHHAQECKKGCN